MHADQERLVRALYQRIIDGWNQRNADGMAGQFAEDGDVVGFDGSQMSGRAKIAATLGQIFASHMTPPYVSKVRSVRSLGPGVAVLRAVVGMAPPGKSELDPALNAIQTLVAVKSDEGWRAALLQTTPAQFHGRPELVRSLTEELRQLLT